MIVNWSKSYEVENGVIISNGDYAIYIGNDEGKTVFDQNNYLVYDPALIRLLIENNLLGSQHVGIRLGAADGSLQSSAHFHHGYGQNESAADLAGAGCGGSFSSANGGQSRLGCDYGGYFQGSYGDGVPPAQFNFGDLPILLIGSFDLGAAVGINGLDLYGGTAALFSVLGGGPYAPATMAGYLFGMFGENTLEAKFCDVDNGTAGSFTAFNFYASMCDGANNAAGKFSFNDTNAERVFSAAFGLINGSDGLSAAFDDEQNMVFLCDGNFALNILIGAIKQGDSTQWDSLGSGTTLLGVNCPAIDPTTIYKWLKITDDNGDLLYLPAWK